MRPKWALVLHRGWRRDKGVEHWGKMTDSRFLLIYKNKTRLLSLYNAFLCAINKTKAQWIIVRFFTVFHIIKTITNTLKPNHLNSGCTCYLKISLSVTINWCSLYYFEVTLHHPVVIFLVFYSVTERKHNQ